MIQHAGIKLTAEEIERAKQYVEALHSSVDGLAVPSDTRTRVAGACFSIALDHHHAIVLLVEARLFAAAFALVRLAFEAYVRGEWLSQCASDPLVEAFFEGKEPPKIDCMLAEMEMLDAFNEKLLSDIKSKSWRSMCAYTHTGGLHVQRWNTADGIEANYDREEVLEIVKFAEGIGSLAIIGVARLANDDELAGRILDMVKK